MVILRNIAVALVGGSSFIMIAFVQEIPYGPARNVTQAPAKDLPEAPAKATYIRVCSSCHGPDVVVGNHHSRDEWLHVVNSMIDNGAQGSDADMARIVYYLNANFGLAPPNPKVNINISDAQDLADGLLFTVAEAQAVVAYRENHGRFTNIDDLKKVPGFDPVRIDAVGNWITF